MNKTNCTVKNPFSLNVACPFAHAKRALRPSAFKGMQCVSSQVTQAYCTQILIIIEVF